MVQKLTKQEFVERAKKAHPNENLDYSRFNYVNQLTKGIIIDHDINPDTGKEYGEYMQSPKLHMAGCGHPLKAAQRKRKAVILPKEDFIKRDRIVHKGENIEYGEYLGMNKKMRFVDHDINPDTGEEYGEYYCLPSNHLKGDGFPGKRRRIGSSEIAKKANKAALAVRTAADKTALFIQKARKVHQGENLDYSKVNYVNNQVPVIIIDHDINPDTGKEYGEYRQTPARHLKGRGHRLKGIQREKKKRACTTEEFIRRAKVAHPNENLDYSKVNYVNMLTPVTIIDHDINPKTGKEYGEYSQLPVNHLKGSGHPEKGRLKSDKERITLNNEKFIEKAKEKHPNSSYDYSKVDYEGWHHPVCIIDHGINPETGKEYGMFMQSPLKHLEGHDNPMRKNEKISESNAYTQEQAISEMKRIHPEPYFDFSKTLYRRRDEEITIICHKKDKDGNEHGPFRTTFAKFISSKCGCPKCNECGTSLKQKEVYEYICQLIGKDNVIENYRGILSSAKQSIDIYIPLQKIGVEFDGLFWHSTGSPNYQGDNAILNKTEECIHKGIFLIHIFEDEWDEHKELVKDKLSYLIGCRTGEKIGARKCTVNTILKHDSDIFLDENHLQGKCSASYYFGGFYNGVLVAVMLFKKVSGKINEYELNRYATKKGFLIQGMASKILQEFIKVVRPTKVISFADRRWINQNKNLYISLGFIVDGIVRPSYWYCGKREPLHRFHKFSFRKSILSKKYGFPMSMTENEMVSKLNMNKIYDCGLIRYALTIK